MALQFLEAGTVARYRPVRRAPTAPVAALDWPSHVELQSSADYASGYGSFVAQIRRGLKAHGVTVSEHPMLDIIRDMPYQPQEPRLVRMPKSGELRYIGDDGLPLKFGTKGAAWARDHAIIEAPLDWQFTEPGDRHAVRLAVGLPEGALYEGADRRVLFTMWESTELPTKLRPWAPHLRRANLILVPAEHSRRVILDQVPEARVDVVPLGLDAERWPFMDRSGRREDRPFIFLQVGDLSMRKGFVQAYQAFRKAFGDSREAVLVYKVRAGSDLNTPYYPGKWVQQFDDDGQVVRDASGDPVLVWNREPARYRVRFTDGNVKTLRTDWSRRGLLDLYRAADCFVWPTLGEGWGYPPREAAATGLPVITCAHTGQTDAHEWAYVIPHHENGMRAVFNTWGGQCGFLPTPDVDALAERMRWVFEHRDEAREFGRMASAVVTRRSSADVARDILNAVSTI